MCRQTIVMLTVVAIPMVLWKPSLWGRPALCGRSPAAHRPLYGPERG
jgi:hypothetical protein